MKRILILILMIVSLSSFGQFKDDIVINSKLSTPGQCFQESSNNILTGMLLTGIGIGLISNIHDSKDTNYNKSMVACSSVAILTGVVLNIRGIYLIGKAGKLMEKERKQKSLTYYVSPNQVGIKLIF